MADLTKVGMEFPEVSYEVTRVKIKELAGAVGDNNPIFLDKEAAISEGYKDTPIQPTFLTLVMNWGGTGLADFITDLNINFAMVLHGEEEYEYYQDIYPGDILKGKPRVSKAYEKESKSGRKMDMVEMEVEYTNQRNEKVAKARMLLVERK